MSYGKAQAGIKFAIGKITDFTLPESQKKAKKVAVRELTCSLTEIEDAAMRIGRQAESLIETAQKLDRVSYGEKRALIDLAQSIREEAAIHGQKRK